MSDLQHRYTESDLARNISNPENKKDGWFYIEPLANEYITDENGTYLNTQAYIERALQIEPKLGSLLQKNDPINEPTYWDITKENLEQIPSQFAEGWATELDVRTNVLMGVNENTDYEVTIQIFKTKQTSFTDDVNFDDDSLIAAALYSDSTSGGEFASQTIVFDHEVVNQDLYIAASGPTFA